jgi:hypothetical protein
MNSNPLESTKSGIEARKSGLTVKPMKDSEFGQSQGERVLGEGAEAGLRFSDAALKGRVTLIRGALVKLRALRF